MCEMTVAQKVEFCSLDFLGKAVASDCGKIAVIYDTTTKKLFSKKIRRAVDGFNVFETSIPCGEKGKTPFYAQKLIRWLYETGFDKKDIIIGVGGGVVTDIVGYVAMQYMRGLKLILVPTTLTAMADAAIGGKNACNVSSIKNLVGGFYLPYYTLIDVSLIDSLPERELKCGMGELIKTQLLSGKPVVEAFFGDKEYGVRKAVEYKLNIVENDFNDIGIRHYLNFGHTIGHAIENISNFTISHGQAVVYGMEYAFLIGEYLGIHAEKARKELKRLAFDADMDTEKSFDGQAIADIVVKDKKSEGKRLAMTFLAEIGKPTLVGLEKEFLKEAVQKCR